MTYSSIDPVINAWIDRHRLHLYTKYQDAEVRAVRLSDSQGRIYAIGIEPPDVAGRIKVRADAWDFRKRNKAYLVTSDELAATLDEALLLVRKWTRE